jgi:hypothetical protein
LHPPPLAPTNGRRASTDATNDPADTRNYTHALRRPTTAGHTRPTSSEYHQWRHADNYGFEVESHVVNNHAFSHVGDAHLDRGSSDDGFHRDHRPGDFARELYPGGGDHYHDYAGRAFNPRVAPPGSLLEQSRLAAEARRDHERRVIEANARAELRVRDAAMRADAVKQRLFDQGQWHRLLPHDRTRFRAQRARDEARAATHRIRAYRSQSPQQLGAVATQQQPRQLHAAPWIPPTPAYHPQGSMAARASGRRAASTAAGGAAAATRVIRPPRAAMPGANDFVVD